MFNIFFNMNRTFRTYLKLLIISPFFAPCFCSSTYYYLLTTGQPCGSQSEPLPGESTLTRWKISRASIRSDSWSEKTLRTEIREGAKWRWGYRRLRSSNPARISITNKPRNPREEDHTDQTTSKNNKNKK